ncbi:hypothetical protein MNBD_GAMMA03-2113 [hydrothermal vent metagenome]|uniref:TIGR00341 family protein n=1 Tax=hydrothermal vent metagenome TaxID=652676 RepID=A0A3B0WX61_9ZZZZ
MEAFFMSVCTVLYDAERLEVFERDVKPLLDEHPCDFIVYSEKALLSLPKNHRVLVWLCDEDLYTLLPMAEKHQWQLGFLPHPEMNRASQNFLVPKNTKEAILDIFSVEKSVSTGLVYCNDQIVLSSVMLGNPEVMSSVATLDEGIWRKLKRLMIMILNLGKMRLFACELETSKQKMIRTAALGVTIVYRVKNSDFTKRLEKKELIDESSLNGLILAPRSIMEMVHFLFYRVFAKQFGKVSLPSYLGHVKSESFTVSGGQMFDYSVDGKPFRADNISVSLHKNVLQVLNTKLPENQADQPQKELVKISGLPKPQSIKELVGRPLPWMHHADLEEVKETFITLSDNAQSSQTYLVLMVLSTLLATIGLFANSAPVIIGAMILAPLMAPIVSLSMGVLRQNTELVSASGKTLVVGVLLAIFFGTLLSLMVPLHLINSEIGARLSPTLLDLGVAIISGIAAAYASARSEIAKSLAGVAIAVALVPPLAVSGIGLSWLDWHVFSGAFLLFITNLAGIILAAVATFFIIGFSPFHLAKKGIMLSLGFVVMISVPLVLAYTTMVEEQRIIYTLEGWKTESIQIRDVTVRKGTPLYISAKLVSSSPLSANQIDVVKSNMQDLLDRDIQLEAISAVVR